MVTVAAADFVGSAALTALTVTVPPLGTDPGAVYRPLELTVPTVPFPPVIPFTLQVTLKLEVFCTVAVNCWVLRTRSVALLGDMLTETGAPGFTTML